VYICYDGYATVNKLDTSKLCLVMEDNFDSGSINEDNWSRLVGFGGFGCGFFCLTFILFHLFFPPICYSSPLLLSNGEFQFYTDFDANAYINNNQLYIFPELTSKVTTLTPGQIFDGKFLHLSSTHPTPTLSPGANISLPTCNIPNLDPNTGVPVNTLNTTACHASSSASQGTVIPPVTSARLMTLNHTSITYGRVDVRAKLPRGDWLWPAIWMLPVDYAYGGWPQSGEIDASPSSIISSLSPH
jgi:hypothetical protein